MLSTRLEYGQWVMVMNDDNIYVISIYGQYEWKVDDDGI